MNRMEEVLKLAEKMGIIRPRDLVEAGFSRDYLIRLYKRGYLIRVGRGLYSLPNVLDTGDISIAEVAKRVPNGVICLISALSFHNLTTQIPHGIWIAIENKNWEPKFKYPPIELVRFTGQSFSFGIEEHKVCNVPVKVYSLAKTVADCFKFRNKIGFDIALESLQEAWRDRRATVNELMEAAKICRVEKVMRPYLEAIV